MGLYENLPYTNMHGWNMDWILGEVRRLSQEWLETKTEWTDTKTEWAEYKAYIDNYFATLDVTDNVRTVLHEMLYNGDLDDILRDELNNVTSGLSTRMNALEARMDTFTNLPDGSTTGDAELQDIRVTYSGAIYPTAGDSVRAQAGDLAKFNTADLFSGLARESGTTRGVTYTFSPDHVVDISGTASGNFSFRNIYYDMTALIPGIVAGRYYPLVLEGCNNSSLQIGFYDSEGAGLGSQFYTENTLLYVPTRAVGMYARFYVGAGVTVNDQVTFYLLSGGDAEYLFDAAYSYNNERIFKSYRNILPDGTDLDSVTDGGCYALDDSTTYHNSPVVSGFLMVYNPSALRLQICVNYRNPGEMYLRRKLDRSGAEWGQWVKISGEGEVVNNYTFNEYRNSYSVYATPTILQDRSYYLDSTGDSRDRTADIITMLVTYGACILGPGMFYVKNLVMPDDTYLRGFGKKSRIVLSNDQDAEFAIKTGSFCEVSDIWIDGASPAPGSDTPIGNRHGILFVGTYTADRQSKEKALVHDVFITGFTGAGIRCYDTGQYLHYKMTMSDSYIWNCGVGVDVPYYSEYHKFTNVSANACVYGCVNNGGNNMFVSCDFSGSKMIAFLMDNSQGQSPNNSHGSAIGCVFNHTGSTAGTNTGIGINILGNNNGFIFSACQIFYSKTVIVDSSGVVFTGCNYGSSNTDINITDGGLILFSSNVHQATPPINIAGNTMVHFANCYNRTTGALIEA